MGMSAPHRLPGRATLPQWLLGVCMATAAWAACAGELDEPVQASLAMRPVGAIRVLLVFRDAQPLQMQASKLQGLPMAQRPGRLAAQLKQKFTQRAEPVMQRLGAIGGQDMHALWLVDAVSAEMPRSRVREVATWPEIQRVEIDVALRSQQLSKARPNPRAAQAADAAAQALIDQAARGAAPAFEPPTAERPWPVADHLAAMDLPRAWVAGHTGRGATVAVVDSGVDLRVPDLARAYRGGAHDWLDPYQQHRLPVDAQGHGTLVTSLLVGGMRAGAPAGVAPHARFIAARLFDDSGQGRLSAVHRVYQWMLDPDGDEKTADAPQLVNNSWGFAQTTDQCDLKLARVWQAYRLVGIPVVFAAGNDGPFDRTSMSPANNPGVISVGALDASGGLARQSSRGPSACKDEAGTQPLAFPTLHAPGVDLPALDRMGSSMGVPNRSDGTSFAAALASGALLLLRQAEPEASIDTLLQRLAQHASTASPPRLAVAQLGAALVGAAGATVRAPQQLSLQMQDGTIVLDDASLFAQLPRAAGLTRLELSSSASIGAVLHPEGKRLDWRPQAPGERLMLQALLGDGTTLPLTVVAAGAPAAAAASQAVRLVSARRDTGLRIELETLMTPGADPRGLRWSQPLRGGRLSRNPDGTLQYQPPERFIGTDQFALRGVSGGDLVVRVLVAP